MQSKVRDALEDDRRVDLWHRGGGRVCQYVGASPCVYETAHFGGPPVWLAGGVDHVKCRGCRVLVE